jgi:hypothetical protein
MRSACDGEPSYQTAEGKWHCVLHFPGKEKSVEFEKALQKKLENKNFNFQGVWFPDEVSFLNFEFGAPADFRRASFSASTDFTNATFNSTTSFSKATFGARAAFRRATFKAKADFTFTTFDAPSDFSFAIFKAGAVFSFSTLNKQTEFRRVTFSEEADFRKVSFNAPAYFNYATFSLKADFTNARFCAKAYFKRAIFSGVVYFTKTMFGAKVNFRVATFNGKAYFINALFSATTEFSNVSFNALASFARAIFNGNAHFTNAIFSATADFSAATFAKDLSFRDTVFRDYIKFAGDEEKSKLSGISSLDLQFTRIEQPEHVSFHHLIVRPHWFVFVNTRQFEFVNVRCRFVFANEIKRLKERKILFPYKQLSRTFRDLAINCEEGHRYKEASRYRYWAMDTFRRERWRGLAFWRLSWWYWFASGYGERVWQAAIVLVILWFVFASVFLIGQQSGQWWRPTQTQLQKTTLATQTKASPDEIPRLTGFRDSLVYSAGVMMLQKPEPLPANKRARTFVLLETILGPVQAALLALAIRRKFMR